MYNNLKNQIIEIMTKMMKHFICRQRWNPSSLGVEGAPREIFAHAFFQKKGTIDRSRGRNGFRHYVYSLDWRKDQVKVLHFVELHLFQLCSRKEKGDWSWRRRWFFQRKTRTFFHELPWQNASCLVTHTLERLSHRRRPLYAFSEEQHSLITKHRKDRKEYPERKANG